MKGINPALDAYGKGAIQSVVSPRAPQKVESQVARQDQQAPAKLTISNEARELAGASAGAGPERVQQLKEAVQQGSLTVDAHAIARRLLDAFG